MEKITALTHYDQYRPPTLLTKKVPSTNIVAEHLFVCF